MDRINTSTALTDPVTGKKFFGDGDPNTGTPATQLNARFFNSLQGELCDVIENTTVNGTPIVLNGDINTQLRTAIDARIDAKVNPVNTTVTSLSTTVTNLNNTVSGKFNAVTTGAVNASLSTLAPGIYASTAGTNTPTSAGTLLHGMSSTGSDGFQLWVGNIPSFGYHYPEVQFRYRYNNGYYSWNKIWSASTNPVSLAQSGYQKLASGLILQWGITADNTYDANTGKQRIEITYPTEFPNYLLSASCTPFVDNGNLTAEDLNTWIEPVVDAGVTVNYNNSRKKFAICFSEISGTSINYVVQSARFSWFAVGY